MQNTIKLVGWLWKNFTEKTPLRGKASKDSPDKGGWTPPSFVPEVPRL